MKFKSEILDSTSFNRVIKRIAHQIIEKNSDVQNIAIIGIKTRGVPIAERVAKSIFEIEKLKVNVGVLDITLYRDDLTHISPDPVINATDIPFDINNKTVVLADDVIYTGRTVRAAMDAVMNIGRPSKIELFTMVDRGHRELPIRADFVGKNVPTSHSEMIKVNLLETDGRDNIEIYDL
ncbi:MAG: bifunctional pyr operon transcriptional regulator/uracil phosphoribosyltransferase PyrR [Clostridia bacterium]|nr:bifunctional pyr operon transcriptional regulator/uracil phosphoribosyltransferase PyrR [Oscillospiraceae bacterium]MDY5626093.1 bifunctional pyr operon transcriptional regulator/uracil phosphoribosyltransferase PyrR [Clostridia bacterium]